MLSFMHTLCVCKEFVCDVDYAYNFHVYFVLVRTDAVINSRITQMFFTNIPQARSCLLASTETCKNK